MDHCPSGDNPGEGNNRNICIVDDDINDIIYIDSDSESSVKICDQKLSSFANDEVEYVKTAAKMAKPPRIRSGQHKAPFSPKDKIGSKLAHRQDKFLSPRKRRTSTSVLSSTMNTNEPKAVKHASNPSTNFSRTNERANNLSEEKNVSSRAIAGSEESLKESKQSSLSAVEQFRSYFGLSSSKNRGPRSPPPFGFDSSQSVADSSFSRPSTPPVDWQISDEGQALTSVRNGSQPVKDDRNVTLLSPFFDSASLKENKTVTKSVVFSSEAERGNAVLPSDSERSCVATDCERGKQELAIQIDSFDVCVLRLLEAHFEKFMGGLLMKQFSSRHLRMMNSMKTFLKIVAPIVKEIYRYCMPRNSCTARIIKASLLDIEMSLKIRMKFADVSIY
jgi:hypothetical protein